MVVGRKRPMIADKVLVIRIIFEGKCGNSQERKSRKAREKH